MHAHTHSHIVLMYQTRQRNNFIVLHLYFYCAMRHDFTSAKKVLEMYTSTERYRIIAMIRDKIDF